METITLCQAGRISLWYPDEQRQYGYLGNFYAQSQDIANELLELAQERFAQNGISTIYGPINGNTWNQYRFVTSGFTNKPFLFEPFNPECYPRYFREFGYEVAASYESSILKTQAKFNQSNYNLDNIQIREFDHANALGELESMYEVATRAFVDNFLYSPISKDDFINQYKPLQSSLDARLVFIAERVSGSIKQIVGFIFAMPYDFSRTCRTVVIKTLCRIKDRDLKGLGLELVSRCHQSAHTLGYTRAVHALYKTDGVSATFNNHHQSKVLRKYSLFKKNI